jgi:catechol 2,3-dioxygenase-like lactoylglutathione lyase family enzyme
MRQIKLVSLLVKDYDAAVEFYTQKLDFEVVEDAAFGDRRWVTLSLPENRCALALELAKNHDDFAVVGKQAGSFPVLALETTDCVGDYQTFKDAGSLSTVSRRQAPGVRAFFLRTCTATSCS